MRSAEGYLRHCYRHVLETCADDLAFLEDVEERRKAEEGVEKDGEAKLRARLETVGRPRRARAQRTRTRPR